MPRRGRGAPPNQGSFRRSGARNPKNGKRTGNANEKHPSRPAYLHHPSAPAFADTFVVNNNVDPGNGICDAVGCTLREAIDAANANPGADIINFSIFGAGVKTITPTSALPTITEAVTIDGYTQPGAAENTLATGNNAVLLVELNGPWRALASLGWGLTLPIAGFEGS
ncbi:MAG: CSLREA domain-containing protein [Verrucomicrobiota bacterium]|nr:CSLREA domain-containing protein [Verrucomicrobiota bacterium]